MAADWVGGAAQREEVSKQAIKGGWFVLGEAGRAKCLVGTER